jgi:hypothetical protein
MAQARFQSEKAIRPVNPLQDAENVDYFEVANAPGLKMFACEPLKATLSQKGCAARWREAQDASGHEAERLATCRGCPIGAAHAGEEFVVYSRHYGAAICPGCRRGAFRMINNRVCVSCDNRRREMRAGRNARGNKLAELMQKPLHAVDYILILDGEAKRVRSTGVVDLLEPMLQTLRTTKGDIGFAFAGPTDGLRQGRLF